MLGADDDKPVGKVSQRKAKASEKASASAKTQPSKKAEPGKKSEPRKRREAKSSIPKPDQLLEAIQRLGAQVEEPISEPILEQASAPAISSESSVTEAPPPDIPEMPPIVVAKPAEMTPVSLQTIADAYGDFSKKSLEQTSTFVAKLATTRSLDKAFELQTAFAREAYETFVAESRKIRELHHELAIQRLRRLEGFVMGTARSR